MKKIASFITKILVVLTGCLLFMSFSPSLDGRAVVVEDGVFPKGLFAKTVGYLPGDIISVASISGDGAVDILVIGALDPSEGVAIMLSPEAASAVGIEKDANNIVKITKRSGQDERVYGSAVIAKKNPLVKDYTEEEAEEFDSTIANEEEQSFEDIAKEPVESNDDTETPEDFDSTDSSEDFNTVEEETFEEPLEEAPVEDEIMEEAPVEDAPIENVEIEEESETTTEIEEDYIEETPIEEEVVEETVPEDEVEDLEEETTEDFPEEPTFEDESEIVEEEPSEEYEDDISPLEDEVPAEEYTDEVTPLEEETPSEEYAEDIAPLEESPEEVEPFDEIATEDFESEDVTEDVVEDEISEVEEPLEDEFVADEELEELPEETDEETYDAIVLVPSESNPPEDESEVEEISDEVEVVDDTMMSVIDDVEDVESLDEEIDTPMSVIEESEKSHTSYHKYLVSSLGDLKSGSYYIQIAALSTDENIMDIVNKYSKNYPITIVPMAGGVRKQVMIGPVTMDEYAVVLERFKSYGYKDAFLRKVR